MKPKVILLLSAVILLTGCSSKKEFLYLSDMVEDAGYVVANRHQTRIQDDDRLKITVSCKNPELAVPFNVSSASVKVSDSGHISANGGDDNVYRVNRQGYINFPVLGEIHVAGMSLSDASAMIRQLIIDGNYIKDPIISIEFMNFHYSVLGAVGNNGTYRVDGDKITVLEAIANAGDLTANADLERIAVIRESDGERKIYTLDITKTDIFNSPAFYLSQNDIIYARPKKPKYSSDGRAMQWISIALAAITASCTVIWAIRR